VSGNGIKDLSLLDRVIHEPARLMIMTILFAVKEADFVSLQRECGLTQGNLSSHLSKLEEVGYLTIMKTFKGKYPLTICQLTPKGREAFDGYSTKMRFVTDPPNHHKG
jgi:DNA-binding transcriptional ArsR family regulator